MMNLRCKREEISRKEAQQNREQNREAPKFKPKFSGFIPNWRDYLNSLSVLYKEKYRCIYLTCPVCGTDTTS